LILVWWDDFESIQLPPLPEQMGSLRVDQEIAGERTPPEKHRA
jgi:hypothetical protein